jgi:hypothetical protein
MTARARLQSLIFQMMTMFMKPQRNSLVYLQCAWTRTCAHKLIERLMEDWTSPIYAFFHPVPIIGNHAGRSYHEFRCFAKSCNKTVRRYLDKKDAASTSNMHKHAKVCWGIETVKAAMETPNVKDAREVLSNHKDGSIAAAFQVKGKGKVTYSHRQHTPKETR